MTSNIVTLPGRAPPVREVPAFTPRLTAIDAEERASLYALSNADETMRLAIVTGTAEGPQAALDMLDNAKAAVRRHFKL